MPANTAVALAAVNASTANRSGGSYTRTVRPWQELLRLSERVNSYEEIRYTMECSYNFLLRLAELAALKELLFSTVLAGVPCA